LFRQWHDALRAAVNSCRVVIYAVTEAWLSSPECFNEFTAAGYMGRPVAAIRGTRYGAALNAIITTPTVAGGKFFVAESRTLAMQRKGRSWHHHLNL
jgi:hypothetical protein